MRVCRPEIPETQMAKQAICEVFGFFTTDISESGGRGKTLSTVRKIGVNKFSVLICASPKVRLRKTRH